jgi:hypothetical protein
MIHDIVTMKINLSVDVRALWVQLGAKNRPNVYNMEHYKLTWYLNLERMYTQENAYCERKLPTRNPSHNIMPIARILEEIMNTIGFRVS